MVEAGLGCQRVELRSGRLDHRLVLELADDPQPVAARHLADACGIAVHDDARPVARPRLLVMKEVRRQPRAARSGDDRSRHREREPRRHGNKSNKHTSHIRSCSRRDNRRR
jgi:hypothetical protein